MSNHLNQIRDYAEKSGFIVTEKIGVSGVRIGVVLSKEFKNTKVAMEFLQKLVDE
jgi:hypothetical protein